MLTVLEHVVHVSDQQFWAVSLGWSSSSARGTDGQREVVCKRAVGVIVAWPLGWVALGLRIYY